MSTPSQRASASPVPFAPTEPYRLSGRVGLRPERFGALAYHFDTRRLVFLKSPDLVTLVESLADHSDAATAIEAHVARGGRSSHGAYVAALASLADAGVVEPRPAPSPETVSPEAVSPEAPSPEAPSPEALSPEAQPAEEPAA